MERELEYGKPVLTQLGKLREITASGGSSDSDSDSSTSTSGTPIIS